MSVRPLAVEFRSALSGAIRNFPRPIDREEVSSSMAKYELMVIYDPFLEEADQSALIEKTQEQVKRRGGALANVDTWGKRRLAYPIRKKQEGFYVLFAFEAPGEGPALYELERT